MEHEHLTWPHIRRTARTILMIVVIGWSIRIVGCSVVQGIRARERREPRTGEVDLAAATASTGEWQAGLVRRVDDRGARSVSSEGQHRSASC